jgi:hypothetical protein
VETQHHYPQWARRWLKAYLYIPVAILPAFPFLAGDFAVSLPLMMVYMLGIGPVLRVVRDPPTCSECGALTAKQPAV